jgi:small subunit ribosomal protein S19e
MVSARDADTQAVVDSMAALLEKTQNVKPPEWASLVKTGPHNERPPTQENWWFVRSASILRKLSLGQKVGVSKLRKAYGGRKNRGHQPETKKRAAGSIIRKILQQLEAEGLAKTEKGKGRSITPKGQALVREAVKAARK